MSVVKAINKSIIVEKTPDSERYSVVTYVDGRHDVSYAPCGTLKEELAQCLAENDDCRALRVRQQRQRVK